MGVLGWMMVWWGLGLSPAAWGNSFEPAPPSHCGSALNRPSLAEWLASHSAAELLLYDRNGKRIGGEIVYRDGCLWLFPQWAEPILLAEGNPLVPTEGATFNRGKLTLSFVEIRP